jgi:UDP-glucose 4-epimerase
MKLRILGDVSQLFAASDLVEKELHWKAEYDLKSMISS